MSIFFSRRAQVQWGKALRWGESCAGMCRGGSQSCDGKVQQVKHGEHCIPSSRVAGDKHAFCTVSHCVNKPPVARWCFTFFLWFIDTLLSKQSISGQQCRTRLLRLHPKTMYRCCDDSHQCFSSIGLQNLYWAVYIPDAHSIFRLMIFDVRCKRSIAADYVQSVSRLPASIKGFFIFHPTFNNLPISVVIKWNRQSKHMILCLYSREITFNTVQDIMSVCQYVITRSRQIKSQFIPVCCRSTLAPAKRSKGGASFIYKNHDILKSVEH
jgi:hypothetical protein